MRSAKLPSANMCFAKLRFAKLRSTKLRSAKLRVNGFLLAAFLLLTVQGAVTGQRGGLTPEQIDLLSASVVQIVTLEDGDPIGSGSGTLVDASGLIFTNAHVVEGGDDFEIYILEDPNELPVLRYYAGSPVIYEDLDFATLQIDRSRSGRSVRPDALDLTHIDPAAIARAGDVARGDEVYIFGYPGIADGYLTLTTGTITTIQNGDVGDERMPVLYQTDAEIGPGNSGGLAVTADGVPLGIPTDVNSEGRTGARLGGILPYEAVLAMVDSGARVAGSARSTRNLGAPDELWDCDNRAAISNGTAVTIIQMRPGYSYTVTVIGVDGFDPVLIVVYPDGSGYCQDDEPAARAYSATLPGVGTVSGAATSTQIVFPQDTGDFADMQIIVGGYGGAGGEFLMFIEGMGVTQADNLGDPFSILMNRSLIASDVPVTAYMVGRETALDPFLRAVDPEDWSIFLTDDADGEIACDDAGTPLCWGASQPLDGASLTLGARTVAGDEFDAMLQLDPRTAYQSDLERLGLLLSSYDQRTAGQYVLVLHMGLAATS